MTVMKFIMYIALVLAFGFDFGQAVAAPQKNTIIMDGKVINGGQGAVLTIGEEQKLMFEASNKFVAMDYKGAEALYGRVIGMNSTNANAWLQRGVIRRELGDTAGMTSDAKRALLLIDGAIGQTPNANLYYQRSLAERLLRQFDAAERDLREAMRLSNSNKWENDLKAIALERKMAQ